MTAPVYTLRDTARITGAPIATLRRWRREGRIPPPPLSFEALAAVWAFVGITNGLPAPAGQIHALHPAPDITVTPGIFSGAPCLTGTRIPTSILASRFRAGESIASIAEDYDETTERVEAAIRFEIS